MLKRVVILGARGMLGHVLVRSLDGLEAIGTVRGVAPLGSGLIGGVDANDLTTVESVLDTVKPDVVINCIGVIKQRPEGSQPVPCIRINALFPHEIAELTRRRGIRFIHWSTDCVFSGRRGPSTEEDVPDPVDVYGRSKLLGEVDQPGALTLRTSLIGPELVGHLGLVGWFLSQSEGASVRGFRRALYTGLATTTAARIVGLLVREHPDLDGVWQVASTAISKYDLLCLLRDEFRRRIEIVPDDDFVCDRRLDGSRFARRTGIIVPSWPDMVRELRETSANGSLS